MSYVIQDISDSIERHPIYTEYPTRKISSIEYIVTHHQGGNGFENALKTHLSNDWPTLSYHYYIKVCGRLILVNPINKLTYHNTNRFYNQRSIGICLEGNLMYNSMTFEQGETLESLYTSLLTINPKWRIEPHSYFKATDCPGIQGKKDMIEIAVRAREKFE